jgi:tetratricopeptide (TPR) repeat protein
MLKILSVMLLFTITQVSAQEKSFDSFGKKFILDLDYTYYPKLKFEWNFEGKVQGAVNTGMTEMLDNKDYEQAIKYFDEAITALPNFAPAYYYRGICYKLSGKIPEAKKDLARAASLSPERPEILLEFAEIHEHESAYPEAHKLYEQAIKLDPGFADAYFNLANLSMREQLFGKADRYLRKCIEIDSTYIKAFVRRGILSFAQDKKPSKTISYFNEALAIDSTFQAALFWRGMMQMRDENASKCLEDWDKLVLYNPENALFILLRALLYLDLKDYDKAFNDLKKVISKRSDDENLFEGLQSIHDKQLDLQFAVSYITRTIYGLQDEAASPLKKGFCLMAMERRREAIVDLKNSYKAQPSALALFLTGLAFEHSKTHDSAYHYYDRALLMDNDIFDAHKKRAIYRSELRDWKGANKDFEEMIRIEPGLIVTYRLRAMIRLQYDDFYGAMIDFSRYLKGDSSDHQIYFYRAFCQKSVKDFKGANKDLRKALAINPDVYDLYEHMVESDLILKDTAHVLETIQSCEAKFGLKMYLFSTRARILIAQKKFAKAREELNRITADKWQFQLLTPLETSTVYFLDGWVEFHQKDFKSALKKFNKSIDLNQENYEALYYRSKIFSQLGETSKAIKDLEILSAANYEDAQVLLSGLQH